MGVFAGYRYYTSKEMPVLFPFGHGLSYTTFDYQNLHAEKDSIKESEGLKVTVDVTNSGKRAGKEVVQLYVSPKDSRAIRPVRELRAFEKIELQPGETKTVSITLDSRAFSYWNTEIHDWYAESGDYEIQIGKSVQEILLCTEVHVESEKVIPKIFHLNSTLGEILADPKGKTILEQAMGGAMGAGAAEMAESADKDEAVNAEMMAAMMESMPLRQLLSFVPGVTKESLEQLIAALNA